MNLTIKNLMESKIISLLNQAEENKSRVTCVNMNSDEFLDLLREKPYRVSVYQYTIADDSPQYDDIMLLTRKDDLSETEITNYSNCGLPNSIK